MNALVLAAESAAPHRFTLDEVFRMMDAGILDPDARVELIDGVLIEMPAEHAPHVRLKTALARWFITHLPETVNVVIDATLRLSDYDAPDPDLYLYAGSIALDELKPADIDLVIEVADSSLKKDLGAKAVLYAAHGVREYWVIEVETLATTVHRRPAAAGYGDVVRRGPDEALSAMAHPSLSLALAQLPLPR